MNVLVKKNETLIGLYEFYRILKIYLHKILNWLIIMKKTRISLTKTFALSIVILALSFHSCTKQDVTIISNAGISSKIPNFKSVESFNDLKNKVFSFTYEELKTWEESQGYKSFGRTCEELYYSVKPTDFKNIEEVKEFVAKHSDLLQLLVDSEGRLTLEVVEYNNPFRYFMDKDGMFQIGTTVYKLIDDNIASTSVENLRKLEVLNSQNLSSREDSTIKVFNYKISHTPNGLKDVAYDCGIQDSAHMDNDRNRTHYELNLYMEDLGLGTQIRSHYLVRPYYYTWPIWYWCTRTISAEIKVAEDYFVSPSWSRFSETYSNSGTLAGKLEGDLGQWVVAGLPWVPHIFHFGGRYFWADTPSTPSISHSCHSELF
jgi:hypothetical protein